MQLKKNLETSILLQNVCFPEPLTTYRSRQSFGRTSRKQSNPYPKKTAVLILRL